MQRDGTLTFFNGAVDIGQGSTTVLTQIAADALGLPPEKFTLVVGDTGPDRRRRKKLRLAPDVRLRQCHAARRARRFAQKSWRSPTPARTRRLSLDGARLTSAPARAREGSTSRRFQPMLLGSCSKVPAPGTRRPRRSTQNGQGIPYATYGFAAQMAEVEVDMRLGTTKVLSIVAAHDVGRAINPTLTEGQIHGGIAQGLGLALMEEFVPGRTENLHDYLIPTVGDMPEIKTYLIEDPDPDGPFGAKGVGEPALIATAPAILGAIRHATGARITRVPALPHRVWEAIHR